MNNKHNNEAIHPRRIMQLTKEWFLHHSRGLNARIESPVSRTRISQQQREAFYHVRSAEWSRCLGISQKQKTWYIWNVHGIMWNIFDFQHLKHSLKKRVSLIETADYLATVFFKVAILLYINKRWIYPMEKHTGNTRSWKQALLTKSWNNAKKTRI